jgi:hypothetical protein
VKWRLPFRFLVPPGTLSADAACGGLNVFDYEPPKEEGPTDYTGLIIVAMLAPVFAVFASLGKPDMGLGACIVLAMMMIAIKLRWELRKRIWFWATMVLVLALHVPLVLIVRWPHGNTPTIVYTMPLGIADVFVILGALRLAENLFSRASSDGNE